MTTPEFFAKLYTELDTIRANLEYIIAEIKFNQNNLTDITALESRFYELVIQLVRLQVQVTSVYLDFIKNT